MPTAIKPSVWTLVTLCAVLGLDGMDVASMSPTLPAIRDELGMSAASLQWVVSAYVIGYGGSCCSAAAWPICSRRGAYCWSRC
jgi:MFS family permease